MLDRCGGLYWAWSHFTAQYGLRGRSSGNEGRGAGCGACGKSRRRAEIFALKALVSAKRSNSRDWFDIYTLIQNHGFTLREFQKAFEKANRLKKLDFAFQRLCSGKPSESDPGFESLLPNPPSVDELASFFRKAVDDYMVAESAEVLKTHSAL
jgi:hypothetical protein